MPTTPSRNTTSMPALPACGAIRSASHAQAIAPPKVYSAHSISAQLGRRISSEPSPRRSTPNTIASSNPTPIHFHGSPEMGPRRPNQRWIPAISSTGGPLYTNPMTIAPRASDASRRGLLSDQAL